MPGQRRRLLRLRQGHHVVERRRTAARSTATAFASFLLGFPSANVSARPSQITRVDAAQRVHLLLRRLRAGRLARELEVHAELRPPPRARRPACAEQNNNFTVGFDPTATSALSSVVDSCRRRSPATPARTVAGGLMYAGVNGNPTTQGNPPKLKWSPRVGARLLAQHQDGAARRLRRLLGAVQLPGAEPVDEQLRPGRLHAEHARRRRPRRYADRVASPTRSRTASSQPAGNSLGALTGVGTTISYVDQNSTAPRVQQYSASTCSASCRAARRSSSATSARAAITSASAASDDTPVNINQLDPKYLALGAALEPDSCRTRSSAIASAGPFATQATLTRAQLLRPYPQFGNVNARHVPEGKNRYNAAVIEWSKRMTQRLGRPRQLHLQRAEGQPVGEDNFYSPAAPDAAEQLQLHPSVPACTTTNFAACYNPDADYGYSLLDVPHRVIIAPMFELPFGKGKKWGDDSSGGRMDRRRLDDVGRDQPAERLPAEHPADRQHGTVRRRAAAEHRAGRRPVDRRAASKTGWPRPITRPRPG